MEVLEGIYTRRSVRRYTDAPIADSQVRALIRAALSAPSAANRRPVHFIVVRDRQAREAFATFHPYAKMLPGAQLGVLVCGDTQASAHFWQQDASAAMENLLLAAHGMGLGAVWMGIYPDQTRAAQTAELFGLPAHILPLGMAAVGVPAALPDAPDRYEADRVHLDRWGTPWQEAQDAQGV
ncbi:MAG: nitroreductase family protein [Christensenellales bacterium]